MNAIFKFIIKHFSLIMGILLVIVSIGWFKSCRDLTNELNRKSGYISDYEMQVASKNSEIRQLNMTMLELKNSKDSINEALEQAYKDLGIKGKNVKELVYIKDFIELRDTINFRDTVFIGSDIDTMIYYNDYTRLGVSIFPPSDIVFNPLITSEKYLVFSYKKEFINEPSKLFFIRWFQKKRKIVTVDIKENNDLIKTEQSRFIDIVK